MWIPKCFLRNIFFTLMVMITSLAFFLSCDRKKAGISEADLIGTWERKEYYEVLTFNEDGTFQDEFVVPRSPAHQRMLVKGTWSLSGASLTYTVTYSTNEELLAANTTFVDEVVSITDTELTYLAAPAKKRVTLHRKANRK